MRVNCDTRLESLVYSILTHNSNSSEIRSKIVVFTMLSRDVCGEVKGYVDLLHRLNSLVIERSLRFILK